jgi:hypothetical protein
MRIRSKTASVALPLIAAGLALPLAARLALPVYAQAGADATNVVLVGHHDLNGNGDGGEGLAIQQWPDGRRILYLAHEAQKTCLSIVDVTRPERPVLINQLPSPTPGTTRCNSLGLSGNVLAVANQTLQKGQTLAGMWALDVSNFERIEKAKTLQDLALSFFDTSGISSRGIHCLWFADGEFAHLTTGMPDFDPVNPNDDQIYVIVDLASWFNGGVRIFHIADGPAGVPDAPPHLAEIGHYIPAPPPRTPARSAQINHAIVDERGLIYANDRFTGGLYILRYTGSVPLN